MSASSISEFKFALVYISECFASNACLRARCVRDKKMDSPLKEQLKIWGHKLIVFLAEIWDDKIDFVASQDSTPSQ